VAVKLIKLLLKFVGKFAVHSLFNVSSKSMCIWWYYKTQIV